MDIKARRNILGGLAALLAAPFFLGRNALARVLAPGAQKDGPPPPRIVPPAHSVKRHD